MVTSTADPWQALADPTRRRVFARVAGGPCSVTEIARDLPVSRPAVSQHLRVLLDARLVDVRPQGRLRLYQMRAGGLDQLRRELDSYWRTTLTRFKDVAERTYPPTATTAEGTPSR
ncbi:MAG: ArsR/SmtB family transcription factor [Labedaea sp.]